MFALRTTPLAVLAAFALAVPATAQVETPEVETPQETLIQALENDGQFTTLVSAIRAAGLEETLASGTYTFFAPTDAAFQNLPEGRLDELMANPEELKALLSLHVASGVIESTSITEEPTRVATLAGSELEVVRDGETVRVQPAPGAAREVMGEETTEATSATVERADWTASNGVIHVIDTVIIPAS